MNGMETVRKHRFLIGIGVVVAVLAFVAIACGDDDDAPTPTGAATEEPTAGTHSQTLGDVQARGRLVCGANGTVPGFGFLEPDGSISVEVMADGLHPTERGYEIWADAVMPTFREMLGASR